MGSRRNISYELTRIGCPDLLSFSLLHSILGHCKTLKETGKWTWLRVYCSTGKECMEQNGILSTVNIAIVRYFVYDAWMKRRKQEETSIRAGAIMGLTAL